MITWDTYSALKMWPVASSTYDVIKNPENFNKEKIQEYIRVRWRNIISIKSTQLEYLAKKEIEILDSIYKTFGEYNFSELCNMTHLYVEWKKHDWVEWMQSSTPMNVSDFFEDSMWQNNIFAESEENLSAAQDIYEEFQGFYA